MENKKEESLLQGEKRNYSAVFIHRGKEEVLIAL